MTVASRLLATAPTGPVSPAPTGCDPRAPRAAGRLPRPLEILDCNVIDESCHYLDSELEPWTVHVEARVTGRVDEQRLRGAVAHALARHPLARARQAPGRPRRRRLLWEVPLVPDVDPVSVVDCLDDADLAHARARLQSLALPLETSPPLRVWLARHPGGDSIILNVHHAASDGIGALRLLRSMARAYAGRADPVLAPLHARTPAVLTAASPSHRGLGRWALLLGELRAAAGPFARVAADGGRDYPGYGCHQLVLSAEQTASLLAHRPPWCTVNDMLVAALHLSIERWNADRGTPSGRVGVLMPVNLRPPAWRHDVVGNYAFSVPVVTRCGDRVDPRTALAAVRRRTWTLKAEGLAALPLTLLAELHGLPVALKRATARLLAAGPLVPTAMLSNLGPVPQPLWFGAELGEASELWFSPPAKMPLGLAIGAVTAGGRLHLSFRYRHPLLGPVAAARFAASYVDTLSELEAGWQLP
jgi:NRPS condensation-like uncharacterized protein